MILASRRVQGLRSFVLRSVFLLPVLACGPALEPPARSALDALPPLVLETVHFSGYEGGTQDFEVKAQRANLRTDEQVAELSGVDIQFHDSDRGPLRVQADRAELNLASDDFVLHENVRGELGDGERFTTSEVRYQDSNRRLFTDQPVRVERGRFAFRGRGMVIDVPTRRLTVEEPMGETR